MCAAALAARAHRERRNSQRKGYVGVGRAQPLLGLQAQMTIYREQGFQQWRIGGELRGGPVANQVNGKGQQATLVPGLRLRLRVAVVHGVLDGAMQRDLQPY